MPTHLAPDLFNRYARQYSERFADVSAYGKSLRLFAKSLAHHAEVLELAAGPGNVSRFVLELRPDLKWLATDLAPEMLKIAAQNHPSLSIQLLDIRAPKDLQRHFDAVMMAFGLPYISHDETLKWISDVSEILGSGGYIYLSTMEEKMESSGLTKGSNGDEIMMYFYEKDWLIHQLDLNGFDLIYEERLQTLNTSGSFNNDLILMARKK